MDKCPQSTARSRSVDGERVIRDPTTALLVPERATQSAFRQSQRLLKHYRTESRAATKDRYYTRFIVVFTTMLKRPVV